MLDNINDNSVLGLDKCGNCELRIRICLPHGPGVILDNRNWEAKLGPNIWSLAKGSDQPEPEAIFRSSYVVSFTDPVSI